MEKKIFNRDDIKAGYLLRCTDLRKDQNGRQFNMTVVPGNVLYCPGALTCCNPGHDWAPLINFGRLDLTHGNAYRIDEVWGYTTPARAMDNSTEGRSLLWRRVERMTLEEIEKALGYKVKVVEKGEPDPDAFKKSSMYAGMVVELREGSKRLVVPSDEGLLLVGDPALVFGTMATYRRPVLRLSEYIDGLTRKRVEPMPTDIVRVWDRIPGTAVVDDAFTTNTDSRRLIWEHDATKRMTLEEIAKTLGHEVEVVATVK